MLDRFKAEFIDPRTINTPDSCAGKAGFKMVDGFLREQGYMTDIIDMSGNVTIVWDPIIDIEDVAAKLGMPYRILRYAQGLASNRPGSFARLKMQYARFKEIIDKTTDPIYSRMRESKVAGLEKAFIK